jgi:5-methylcytosine-specific restriction protein B
MTGLNKVIAGFIGFANSQSKGKGVQKLKEFDKTFIKQYSSLDVKFSVGKGRATNIPWISFLGPGQQTQDGIYPVILFYKEYGVIVLAYGISERNKPKLSWNLTNAMTINDYFKKSGFENPEKYGESYVSKVYDSTKIRTYNIESDLLEIIDLYKKFFSESKALDYAKDNFLGSLESSISSSQLHFNRKNLDRFTASLLTKPFVILTGLSGSGKTKLAQAFAMWISEKKEQYALVPVGADWTNREPLLGYPNSLNNEHYVKPDTGVLDILLRAHNNYIANAKDLAKCTPYFLILDEMNLSHVERYFADFLSTMESEDEIKLYSGSDRYAEIDSFGKPYTDSKIPDKIILPKNLFIIGTVNIDETTYMFSPKVLDRANTIEFRIKPEEMEAFYQNNKPLNMDALEGQGKDQAPSFMSLAARENISIDRGKHKDTFLSFFETLNEAGAEFGYRTANEMTILVSYLVHFGMSQAEAYDVAIMQKLLPKLHGSRSKLSKVLPKLITLCEGQYPISLEKLERMKKNAEENGFASYAEA